MRTQSFCNSPHTTNTSGGQGSGHYLRSLLHEASDREPQAVSEGVLVLQHVPALSQTRVRVVPLVRAQPGAGNTGTRMTLRLTCSTVLYVCRITQVRANQSLDPCQSVCGRLCTVKNSSM